MLGDLGKFPREIRDIIYRPLIHAGKLNILETSKTINEEASKIFFKDRACRMNFGYNTRTPTFFPTQELANKLQNLRFNINYRCRSGVVFDGRFSSYGLWESCDRKDIEHIRKFAGSDISRRLCMISFSVYATAEKMFDPKVLEVVKLLTGFDLVILEIRVEWLDRVPYPESLGKSRGLDNRRFEESFEMARGMLEPNLGPAVLARGTECGGKFPYRQIYYPRKHAENVSRKLAEALGTLVKLPLELREMVYRRSFAVGGFSILQASKAVNQEATPTLFKTGTCIMKLGFDEDHTPPMFLPSQELADKLQNIRLNISHYHLESTLNDAWTFWTRCEREDIKQSSKIASRPDISRQRCVISFLNHFWALRTRDHQVLDMLKLFTGFEIVIIEIRVEKPPVPGICASQKEANDCMSAGFELLKAALEPTLGPAELGFGDGCGRVNGLRQVYHPRKHVAAPAKKSVEA